VDSNLTSHTQVLTVARIINRSGYDVGFHPSIETIRTGRFRRIDAAIVGDAPKDFLRVYEYGTTSRSNPSRWPAFIAKVGQKWYPNESITEHLLTRLGQRIGIRIADSRLMWVRGQLRFLSRYFLRPGESLVHGAEIFAGHLADRDFVEEVERQNQARNVFTFQVVEEAVGSRFPDQASEILQDFVRLLVFDALIGNNDRHYFNWGVVTDIRGTRPPRFSPVYDTARALFWNSTEAALEGIVAQKRIEPYIEKYVTQCIPKIGWDGKGDVNHFDLIHCIAQNRPEYQGILASAVDHDFRQIATELFAGEFTGLFTCIRQKLVAMCLAKRQEHFRKAIGIA
jgi:hypothetical protein